MSDQAILDGTALVKRFTTAAQPGSAAVLTAVDGVTLRLLQGESHGIAGESGCGKSTLGKILAGLTPSDSGYVSYRGTKLSELAPAEQQHFRRTTQMVFQDPFSALNPRMRIGDIVAEPLVIARMPAEERHATLARMIEAVGLGADVLNRFPDEFSGGQRQRIGIARALIGTPEIVVADEPVSSLDISVQAQIINLLMQLKQEMRLSMLVISHNLTVLRHICDTVSIMYLGIIVETASAADIFRRCRHPYTEALLAAIPDIGNRSPKPPLLTDDLPSPLAIPSGCRFHPRCRHALDICRKETPPLRPITGHHYVACHLSEAIYGGD